MKIAEKEFEGKQLMNSAGFRVPWGRHLLTLLHVPYANCKYNLLNWHLAPGTFFFNLYSTNVLSQNHNNLSSG